MITRFLQQLSTITLFFFFSARPALAATCRMNGVEVPCDQIPKWIIAMPIVLVLLFVFLFVFWVWMLIDAIKYQKEDKLMWVILIIFCNVLGAAIYYFLEKKKRKK